MTEPVPLLTLGSLCSGYRGLDMAVEEVFGVSTAWVSDVDEGANKILAHRWPDTPNLGDLTAADWHEVLRLYGRPHVVAGGYPCQPFSLAGLLKGTADDRHLWPYIARALRVLRPRLAVFENVANHLRLGFDTVLCDLAELGFDVEWCVVRADETGATHQRRRLFVLAIASDAPRLGRREGQPEPGLRERGAVLDSGSRSAAAHPERDRRQGQRGDTDTAPRRPAAPAVRRESPGGGAAAAHTGGGGRGARPGLRPQGESGVRRGRSRDAGRSPVEEPQCPTCGCGESFHDAGGFCAGCHGCTDPDLGRPGEPPADTDRGGLAGQQERDLGPDEPGEQTSRGHDALRRRVQRGAPADASGERHGDAGPARGGGLGAATVAGGDSPDGDVDWGRYLPAILRWEAVSGLRAPRPTDANGRLNPAFVEWMMGLEPGHVTGVPGLTRAQQLRALGNGVVPQQATAAIRLLAERAGVLPPAASLPPLGRCRLCGLRRHVSEHRSTRDGLLRLLCTPCYSAATLAEESGHPVDWDQALATGSDDELTGWLGGAL